MERLTQRNEHDTSYYIPECFEMCDGLGCSEECNNCHVDSSLIKKLGAYEDAEEQGLLAKVVHAEWVDVNGFTFRELPVGHKWCECSNCNFEIMNTPYNYCPNCGAKMSTKE